jgi:tetratricopeptide (TPR) repeat protein
MRVVAACAACFVAGVLVQAAFVAVVTGQGKGKPGFDPAVFEGSPPAVAAKMPDNALVLAEQGSWERIAVGRAWYLGGDKARGQQIFDGVTSGKKVEGSDYFRIARVYVEAGEWDKARTAFDKAMALNADDDSGAIEYGAFANLNGDRTTAEGLFRTSIQKKPKEFWHWVNAGGSYLGVKPQ